MNLSVVNVNAKAMNEYTKYLLSLLEVSEWCVPIHETVVGELRRNLAQ